MTLDRVEYSTYDRNKTVNFHVTMYSAKKKFFSRYKLQRVCWI